MTTAGIFGQLMAVDDESVELAAAPAGQIKYAKAAIARILDEEVASTRPRSVR